jgi:phospholipid/cholesterol/gamma-HCH transport system ATP-binding protein
MIRIDDVHIGFGRSPLLRGVSLEVDRGVRLGIIGPAAGGKSVLLKLLCGLLRPDRGRIRIDGTDITELPERALMPVRNRIGMLFQNYALFDFMTVADNVAFPAAAPGRRGRGRDRRAGRRPGCGRSASAAASTRCPRSCPAA